VGSSEETTQAAVMGNIFNSLRRPGNHLERLHSNAERAGLFVNFHNDLMVSLAGSQATALSRK
jgi:hypothetical protein